MDPQGLLFLDIYLPRYLCAILVGIDLSISGFLMHILTKNRLADTKLMGISSGGLVAVALLSVFGLSLGHILYYPSVFLGCLLAALAIFLISIKKNGRPIYLLLAGIGISSLLYSLAIAIFVLNHEDLLAVYAWTTGSLSHANWTYVFFLSIFTLIFGGITFGMAPSLKVYELGRESAMSLGMRYGRYSFALMLLIALFVSAAVCVAGSIGFLGLMIPNIARLFFAQNYRHVVLCCTLLGGILLLLCQMLSSALSTYNEIPVGCMTAILGALFLLLRNFSWFKR